MMGRIAVCFIGILFSCSVAAEGVNHDLVSENKVSIFFKNLKTITADFEQIVQNAQLGSSDKASGKLWIERPGKFRWDYTAPYEQEIVSDGKKLWIFDKDLEQVTARPINLSMENTPAVLLSDTKPIGDAFTISDAGVREKLNWTELTPKDPEASFTGILLGFSGSNLSKMFLKDNLGQTTELTFSNLKRNDKIASQKFVFTPPEGVDVFDSAE